MRRAQLDSKTNGWSKQAGKRKRDAPELTWVADVLGHHVHLFDNAATELEIESHLDLRKQVDVAVVQ